MSATTSSGPNFPLATSVLNGFLGGSSPSTCSGAERYTRERSTVSSPNSPGASDMISVPGVSHSASNTIWLPEVAVIMMSASRTASRPDAQATTSMPSDACMSSQKLLHIAGLRL